MKLSRIPVMVLIIAGLGLGLPACQKAEHGENVVARFDDGSITVEDLEAHLARLKKNSRFRDKPEMLTPAFVLEHAVNMEMIIAKGLKENLHRDPRIRAEIHDFMADLFLKVMQDNLVPEIDKADFSEDEIRAYFDAHPESYRTPARYDVKVIRADDSALLDEILKRIENGEITFEAAARQYSTDASTREKGGAVGTRPLNRFRPDWRETVAALAPVAVSTPTRIGDAWYLLKLERKTEAVPQDYEERKAYVRNDLLYARYRDAWEETYDRLKAEFSLEVDDEKLKPFLEGGPST
ncbi:peptidylprolyl isomerase [uncultured Desulfosarcina sp.]|uniref:peptidylprolyl isomerase n=1 Tax=uncultured Desulfosarcina sp. TaxID=218289 RepID=UPI0029C65733|nr:peptidylprolyl isomerase [uncultured Desulfosarcina sp.]